MYNPTEIIFSVTDSCNLHCNHCYVSRNNNKLNPSDAKKLIQSCKETDIQKIGFSGGEPFLYTDFLTEIIRETITCDMLFDRLMTNGVWWNSEENLSSTLIKIYDAGFDGKIGLSWDSFHGQDIDKITTFIKKVHFIFGPQSLEIQSVISKQDDFSTIETLAEKLCCKIYKELNKKTGQGIIFLQNEEIYIPIYREPQSFPASDNRSWTAKKWFKDDFCEGPGQIFYVHADGNIAPCCGFANESPALFIGTIKDDYNTLMKNAAENPLVKICYETGLRKEIKILKKQKQLPPGKTGDICAFCEWMATRNQ